MLHEQRSRDADLKVGTGSPNGQVLKGQGQGQGRRQEVKTVRGGHLLQKDHESRGLLLCCVCHEQNTTYRYEVVYRSATVRQEQQLFTADQVLERVEYTSAPRRLFPRSNSRDEEESSGIETGSGSSDDHEYYNFPPRHPRHGHLQWPVFDPAKSVAYEEKLCLTYPDYPVHIPTTTLSRVVVVSGKGSAAKGKKNNKSKNKKKGRRESGTSESGGGRSVGTQSQGRD